MGDDIRYEAEKRAHHNALERKRRDHIKDNFILLREAIPSLQGEKTASRAQILKKAADYIVFMHQKNDGHQQDVEDLKRQNRLLEKQISILERTKRTGIFAVESSEIDNTIKNLHLDISSDSEQDYSASDISRRDNS